MIGEDRVERLLKVREGVPWAEPSVSLRARTMSAVAQTRVETYGLIGWKKQALAAAAACVVVGVMVLRATWPSSTPAPVATMKLDPVPMLGSALREITASAEQSMQAEAREFLEDAEGLTRRVVAQLPFTRGS